MRSARKRSICAAAPAVTCFAGFADVRRPYPFGPDDVVRAGDRKPMSSPSRRILSRRRATLKDVAEAVGVSQSTTSRALSGEGYVAPAVRDRVRAAAAQLGYVPHAIA